MPADDSVRTQQPVGVAPPPPPDAWLAASVAKPPSSTVWIIVALPNAKDDGTVALRLLRAGLVPHSQEPRVFVRKTVASPRPLAHMIEALVGGRTKSGLRMAVIAGENEPSLTDVHTELEDLTRATARLRAQWLMPLLVSRRVYAMLMPIFDGRGEVFAEEALGRADLSADETVTALPLFDAARDLDLVTHLDRVLRGDAFAAFSRAYPFEKPRLFVRASSEALTDAESLLVSFAELSRARAVPPAGTVIEISERSVGDERRFATAFDAIRASGMRVALSGLMPGPRAEQLLSTLRPDFAKLDGECVRGAGRASSQSDRPDEVRRDEVRREEIRREGVRREGARDELRDLVDAATAVGATVIASGIESPDDLKVAQASGASLYSGFLLCRPRRL
jgi:EAL domain-containing protein (putative c-di-GMP-specific phosphodiesterase class I)